MKHTCRVLSAYLSIETDGLGNLATPAWPPKAAEG